MALIDLADRWKRLIVGRPAALAVIGLLVAYAFLALASVRDKSGTFDELFHVTGGYTSWVKNDYRIHNTNGNLVQRWIALPLLTMSLELPAADSPGWRRPAYFGIEFGHQFFFRSGNDPDAMLRRARAMVVILGVALAALTGLWSRRLFGMRAGLVSLSLFAFSPTMLAHGQLATSDMAAALAFTGGTWCLWTLLHRLTPATLAASCLVVGAAAVVKFSTPMLGIVAAVMAGVRVIRNRPWTMRLGGRTWLLRGRLPSGRGSGSGLPRKRPRPAAVSVDSSATGRDRWLPSSACSWRSTCSRRPSPIRTSWPFSTSPWEARGRDTGNWSTPTSTGDRTCQAWRRGGGITGARRPTTAPSILNTWGRARRSTMGSSTSRCVSSWPRPSLRETSFRFAGASTA